MSALARLLILHSSFLMFIAIISFIPAEIVGGFFALVAGYYGSPESGAAPEVLGALFGFCVISIVLIGAIAVPGSLLGLTWPYRRKDKNFEETRRASQKVLLVAVSVLAWVALVSLGIFASLLR